MPLLPIFKIHCSAIHHIVTGLGARLTAKQQATLDEYLAKDNLTLNDKKKRDELIEKRDRPLELSAGAKTYVEEWVKSALYYEKYEFTSKYTDKGNECEQDGIDMVCERMGYGFLTKNEQTFEDEYMIGTPDVITKDCIEEIKCPYSSKTFPLFDTVQPNPAYDWQQQGYMNLTKRIKAAVNYCLINAPEFIVELETNKKARSLGMIEVTMELVDEIERNMSYDDVPIELRHKRFEIERDDTAIATIKTAVILCREYIAKLMKGIQPPTTSIVLHDPSLPHTTIHDNN